MVHELTERVRLALVSLPVDVFHYHAFKKKDRYIVWAEQAAGGSVAADDRKQDYSISGYIDFFTREEHDPVVDMVSKRLKSAGIAFSLNSVQYEEETRYIHYEWLFEVV